MDTGIVIANSLCEILRDIIDDVQRQSRYLRSVSLNILKRTNQGVFIPILLPLPLPLFTPGRALDDNILFQRAQVTYNSARQG